MAEAKVPRPRTSTGVFGNTRATLYTAPPQSRSETVALGFTTVAGTSPSVTVELFRSSDSSRTAIYFQHTSSPVHSDEVKLVLNAGDRIEVTANGTDASAHAYVTVNEVFVPVG